ncbi:MAG TPA: DegT/DnrJ/EryC1/StrS family aminotransferase [Verrucomicrobiota bacterium]|nr:DegT/DnrJ/EryC1/StrS family aminotransferase [Verrucomicrobiota bacterium]HNT13966.1 DegT/DnrJ/EryC1/StrS family aminotransferase [Verrucomicrobiota bacterium]
MQNHVTRRKFLGSTTVAGAGLAVGLPQITRGAEAAAKPAALGGSKAFSGSFPGWPVVEAAEEEAVLATLRSKHWYRGSGKNVARFEDAYQQLTGARHALATASGTAALTTALGALHVGPGDEVITTPYTFVATYNVIVLNYALPIFVDVDPESFQIDADKIEAAITPQTKALLPVHIAGSPADLDKILAIGQRHKLPVIEDACQAHLGEWRGRKVGTLGLAGCFSFQASKNLNSGEGGAVLTNDDQFADACYHFHTQGQAKKVTGASFSYAGTRGSNLRLCEFQGGLLLAQMTRVVAQTQRRTENAQYLTQLLREIPGITPAKLYPGTTRSAYHLYMFRYDPERFARLPRAKFLAALGKEGVGASGGYGPMHRGAYVANLAQDPHFLKVYGEKRMQTWLEQTRNCPQNDRVCEQAVWFTQNMLLGPRTDMDQIAEAIRKIQKYAAELV